MNEVRTIIINDLVQYCYKSAERSCRIANDTARLAVIDWLVDKFNKEIAMADQEAKRIAQEKKTQQEYQQWQALQELSKAHWSHWRAWGSWFSWGSPVGLGIFFVLVAVTFAIFKWAISL